MSDVSKGVSRCMCRRASPVSRSVPMDDRRVVFTALNDRSAEQVVTGSMQRILSNARMLGNIEVECLRACVGWLVNWFVRVRCIAAATLSSSNVAPLRCKTVTEGPPDTF